MRVNVEFLGIIIPKIDYIPLQSLCQHIWRLKSTLRVIFMKVVYDRVAALCQLHKLTVNGLETKIGVKHGTIQKWKSRETGLPSCVTLVAIADYFETSVDFLLGREVIPLPLDSLAEKIHGTLQELSRSIAKADEEIQQCLRL